MFVEIDFLFDKLKSIRPISPDSVKRLTEDFIIDYTYNSNAIEGSTLTLDETALILKEGVTIGGKPLKHHLEAIGHRDAYYFVEDLVKNNIPLSEKTMKDIHSLVLMDRQTDKGVYRSVPVRVGSFYPCQPYEVPIKMEQLMTKYHTEMENLHVIERAAIFHIKFETIHPFIDGNGRAGRLILNLEFMKSGFPPINVKFSDRERYYNCFNKYRENNEDASFMIELMTELMAYELKRYIAIAEQSDLLRSSQPHDFDEEFEDDIQR